MFFFAACMEFRNKNSDVSDSQLATWAGVGDASIKRFEKERTFPTDNLDAYAAAYARLDGSDPRDVFKRAVELWYAYGLEPLTADTGAAAPGDDDYLTPKALLKRISLAEESEKAPSSTAKQPTSTRRRQAG